MPKTPRQLPRTSCDAESWIRTGYRLQPYGETKGRFCAIRTVSRDTVTHSSSPQL
ncbi:hypothetical protein ACIBG8_13330 [Nonomuraea sp. NPDC050556]|uniref:hypothetical protein n=1 Tax=Nonomuraea sp. NPDC050556 TaxID=3364369 RepID=UPI0037A9A83E